jgi:hypothetical protein
MPTVVDLIQTRGVVTELLVGELLRENVECYIVSGKALRTDPIA